MRHPVQYFFIKPYAIFSVNFYKLQRRLCATKAAMTEGNMDYSSLPSLLLAGSPIPTDVKIRVLDQADRDSRDA